MLVAGKLGVFPIIDTNGAEDGIMRESANIKSELARFASCESGAVTVDWVVLTAAVVGLVTAIFLNLGNETADVTPKHPPRLSVIVSFMVSRICHFARVFFLSCLNSVAPG